MQWRTPDSSVLGRQEPRGSWAPVQPGLHSQVQPWLYSETLCQERKQGAKEKSQLVESLLNKDEDLSSDPPVSTLKTKRRCLHCDSSSGEAEGEDPWDLLASLSYQIGEA